MAPIESTEQLSSESQALEYLVSSGLGNDSSYQNDISSLPIYLSESQMHKVDEYCQTFGVSVRTMLNSCIQYVLFLAQKKDVEINQLKDYPKRLGKQCHEVALNAETLNKLKKTGSIDPKEIGKCAVAGVKILYDKNLRVRKRKTSNKK